jgi:hypothetical protein
MTGKAVAAIVALIAIWFFFLRKRSEADQLGTSGSTTLGIAELYFDPGVNFPVEPITGDVKPSGATP